MPKNETLGTLEVVTVFLRKVNRWGSEHRLLRVFTTFYRSASLNVEEVSFLTESARVAGTTSSSQSSTCGVEGPEKPPRNPTCPI